MEVATQCNISVLEFWDMTPREISIQVESYSNNIMYQHDQNVTLVYLNNAWSADRCKRLPQLSKFLSQKEEPKQEDILDVIKKANAAMGGTVY